MGQLISKSQNSNMRSINLKNNLSDLKSVDKFLSKILMIFWEIFNTGIFYCFTKSKNFLK